MQYAFKRVSVIGLGYVGLPTAALLASRGLEVVGVDVNPEAVAAINGGKPHLFEPGLEDMVRSVVADGRLRAVTTPEPAEAFLIAVPTPVSEGSVPDLSYVEAASAAIAPVLVPGNLVILESTSQVGTIELLSSRLGEARPDLTFPHGCGENADIRMAYCPERILPGRVLTELVENDRIIGGLSNASAEAAATLYRVFAEGELLQTDGRTAEMAKLVENAFRDVNIAFANELSKVCDQLKVDVWEVIELANHHPRVSILKPGPGVGGHCIAVDPWFIVHASPRQTPLIQAARAVNDSKPAYVVERIRELAGPKETIACLGLAYKADSDDLRESPSVRVVELLAKAGYQDIVVVEPHVDALPSALVRRSIVLSGLDSALERARVVLLLVDHTPFKELPEASLRGKILYDTRGIWPQAQRSRGRTKISDAEVLT